MPGARALLGVPCSPSPCLFQGLQNELQELAGRATSTIGAAVSSLAYQPGRHLRQLTTLTIPPLPAPPPAPAAPSPVPAVVAWNTGTTMGGTGFVVAVLAVIHLLFLLAAFLAFVIWRRTVREEERRRRERAAAEAGAPVADRAGPGQRRGGLDPHLLAALPTLLFQPSGAGPKAAHPDTAEAGGGGEEKEWGLGGGREGEACALSEAAAGSGGHSDGCSEREGETLPLSSLCGSTPDSLAASPGTASESHSGSPLNPGVGLEESTSEEGAALGLHTPESVSLGSRGLMVPLGPQSECSVCLQEYKAGESMKLLPDCGHTFHGLCIEQWLGSHSTCPICRVQVGPALEEMAKKSPD